MPAGLAVFAENASPKTPLPLQRFPCESASRETARTTKLSELPATVLLDQSRDSETRQDNTCAQSCRSRHSQRFARFFGISLHLNPCASRRRRAALVPTHPSATTMAAGAARQSLQPADSL